MGRSRRRRRSGQPFLVLVLVLLGCGAVAAGLWYGYHVLSQDLRDRIAALQAETQRLDDLRAASERARGTLSVELEDVRAQLRYLESRYERDVPSGDSQRLHDLAVQMLEQGVEADRLAFLIRSAQTPAACDDTAETKQFMVAVPGLPAADGRVTFADRRITVTADGQVATDDQGRVEAWYDPTRSVRVRFARLGGETEDINGPLPLHHSMVIGGDEYRFTIAAGQTGFAEATAIRCNYP